MRSFHPKSSTSRRGHPPAHYLDMLCSFEQSPVEFPRERPLLLARLEVDVGLPEQLGHVQRRLAHCQLVDGACPLDVAQQRFEFGEFDPAGAVVRTELETLLVEQSASVELAQLQLQFDVATEQLLFWTFPNSRPLQMQRYFAQRLL